MVKVWANVVKTILFKTRHGHMITNQLGLKLRGLRIEKGMPLRKAAAALDIDQSILSKYERGQRLPSECFISKAAKHYGFPAEELLALSLSDRFLSEATDSTVAGRALQIAEQQILYGLDRSPVERNRESRFMDATPAKLRGGYYTPADICEALCAWAIRRPDDFVLEPSCGDGAFVEAAVRRLTDLGQQPSFVPSQLKGIEVVPTEIAKARKRIAELTMDSPGDFLESGDYFVWYWGNRQCLYDCVVGNPPFIRYQSFPEPSRSHAMRIMECLGLKPNRLTNIWVPFLVAATSQLKSGGRLAMVVPAELLQVSYAAQLRGFLTKQFEYIRILACNDILFERAEQEVVLLLADGRTHCANADHSCHIELVEEDDISSLLHRTSDVNAHRDDPKTVQHDREKWLKYFLTSSEIRLMRDLKEANEVSPLGCHASVDVGVVTGKNAFFVLSRNDACQYDIEDYVIPLVGRSAQLRGADLSTKEWWSLARAGQPVCLFYVQPDKRDSLSAAAKRYIEVGERKKLHTGYKCSIRDPWYCVPSVWIPNAFLFRQIYDFPRAVRNGVKAVSTDTIHRLNCKNDPQLVLRNLYTHLTAASAEIEGRSYGGGVLELEPSEAEKLLLPRQLHDAMPLKEIDRLIRSGQLSCVLEENDRRVLQKGMGLSRSDCTMLKNIWVKMRDRRQSRKRSPSSRQRANTIP